MNDPVVIGVLILIIASGIAWGVFQIRNSDEPVSFVQLLKAFALPLFGLGLVAVALFRAKSEAPVRLPGDDDLEPEQPKEEDRETQGEQVRRVIEEQADRVEEHILEKATDAEVRARGAALFDPGAE